MVRSFFADLLAVSSMINQISRKKTISQQRETGADSNTPCRTVCGATSSINQ
jgi:hypothetical protein